ncbi:nuclear transport factor 2 family protein [Sediminibacterium sp.]|uniref:YybH family protein n=1 Tax=Sediminibacterium sp. TaxID=1917865 RepID=UPI0025EC35C3|nr:nuclear transport factor 2 family protein [Sediminibacterium sp.]MBW0177151.1 nuclear transport factor 2 family protein [Sediminibacterium sp.]
MKWFTLFLFIGFAQPLHAQTGDEKIIHDLLERQTRDWNRGDIDAFMKGYWESDSLMFVGKNGATYGYQKTLNNYKKNYPDSTSMGKLRFNILEVRRLSATHYFVLGKWMLTRSIGDLSGHYTLLLKKIKGKWTIIADHSS